MKILLLNKLYFPHIGGIEKVVESLALFLKDKGHNVKVLVANKEGFTKVENIRGVEVTKAFSLGIYFSMPVSFSYPVYLNRFSRWANILHIHLPFPLGVLSYLIIRPKNPIIVTWHSDIVRQKLFLFFYKWFLFRFLEKVDVIIPTTYNLAYTSSFLPYFLDKVFPIPLWLANKVDRVLDTSYIKERYGERIILFVGRFVYYKGIYHLLEAMKGVEGVCILIGNGKEISNIKRFIKDNELSHKVFILTNITDEELPDYYQAADIFVLPSIYKSEAYGLVLLEAMYYNTPIITFDLPTGVSFVNDGKTRGIRIPLGNVNALKLAINRLLNNKADLRKKGIYGKRWVENLEEKRSDYIKLYKYLERKR